MFATRVLHSITDIFKTATKINAIIDIYRKNKPSHRIPIERPQCLRRLQQLNELTDKLTLFGFV